MVKKLVAPSLLLAGAVFAQPSSEVQALREEMEVLKEELRKLKLEISMPQITTYESYTGLGPAASKALINPKGVSIGGYGEIWFDYNPNRNPRGKTDVFRYIMYLGYAFNDKLKFNSEIEIEHTNKILLEFAFIDYRVNKSLGIRGGQVLIPIGITNEYHEPPTYFSVRQPYVEKKLFPFTWKENGVGVYGDTEFVEYRAYVINPMKAEASSYKDFTEPLDQMNQNGGQANMQNLGFTGRVDFKLPMGLKIGTATFISPVEDTNGNKLGTISLISPHLWLQYAGFDVRFVGAYANISGADNITSVIDDGNPADGQEVFPEKMQGFYLQVAYNVLRFLDTEQELYVFGKVETVDRYNKVPTGYSKPKGKASKLDVINVGIAYKPHPLVSLKADYARESYKEGDNQHVYSSAITWMF